MCHKAQFRGLSLSILTAYVASGFQVEILCFFQMIFSSTLISPARVTSFLCKVILIKLCVWLNNYKCKQMQVTVHLRKKQPIEALAMFVNGRPLEHVTSYKHLRILITSTWAGPLISKSSLQRLASWLVCFTGFTVVFTTSICTAWYTSYFIIPLFEQTAYRGGRSTLL